MGKKGERMFKKHCAKCHSIYSDNRATLQTGGTQVGPSLFKVYGRRGGEAPIANKEPRGDRATGMVWTAGHLMNYMKNPRQAVDGNVQMNFRGIEDFQTRVDIVHFLKTLNKDNSEVASPPERSSSWQNVFPMNVVKNMFGRGSTPESKGA